MPLSHFSHYEDMYLDNCIAVTETDMTVRRPQKSEHGNAADQWPPKSWLTFWGEEEQRNERTFRACTESERYGVCDDEGQAYKNDIGSTALTQKHNYQRKKEGETHEQATTDRCRYPVL